MLQSSFYIVFLFVLVGSGLTSGNTAIRRSIIVDQSGKGQFRSIQEAINSVPDGNKDWIRIHLNQGVYREKVMIPAQKEYILLEGSGSRLTVIQWGEHAVLNQTRPNDTISVKDTMHCATFTVFASNFKAKDITFSNAYNLGSDKPLIQAVAALVGGDMSSFYNCRFLGTMDTLCDYTGRHYFRSCFIEGFIDFIFGFGQSIYDHCTISTLAAGYNTGYITAHGRQDPKTPGGFVFKYSTITGKGKAYLGRAWGPYSTVVFYKSYLSDIVVPEGWNAWEQVGHESQLTYAEDSCQGPGSNLAKRVKWMKKPSRQELGRYVSMRFIDREGWLSRQPY